MTDRNTNARFELAPQVAIERSTFDRSCNIKTSFDVGRLVPFYVDEVLPGDTFQIQTSKVARLQTLLTPIMDNLFLDTYYFFVPNRLIWKHWKEFCGENSSSPWIQSVEYSLPGVRCPGEGWSSGTIADYMGIPTETVASTEGGINVVNALPFRAYALIVNEWFRDENLQQPVHITLGDGIIDGSIGDNYVTDLEKGGKPFIACKYHDYFTSCLPAPQKGPDVSFLSGYAPIVGTGFSVHDEFGGYGYPPQYRLRNGNQVSGTPKLVLSNSALGKVPDSIDEEEFDNLYLDNMFADLSKAAEYNEYGISHWSTLTINTLRQAFQVQRLFEKDARGGTRYIEILKSHFGVTSPDARLQRPEYLGGNRVPLNVEQVVQTADGTQQPLAHLAAYSQTADSNYDVNKSFVEHGYIIGLMCARYDHSYQQGLEPMWTRETRFDFYWPALAHLGEKPVWNREIYWSGTDTDDEVFGYQEAWAEYKYKPNYITGEMRSAYAQGLDMWHFGDWYNTLPTLSASWIKEDKTNVDRTLAVTSAQASQIFADILVSNKCTRPMPLYSIPGLIDHF